LCPLLDIDVLNLMRCCLTYSFVAALRWGCGTPTAQMQVPAAEKPPRLRCKVRERADREPWPLPSAPLPPRHFGTRHAAPALDADPLESAVRIPRPLPCPPHASATQVSPRATGLGQAAPEERRTAILRTRLSESAHG